jgi:pantoate--beta-alanine ligase
MGYLHPGHTSLVEAAHSTGRCVALSIFVNPLQFGPAEDFDNYPRDLASDLEVARAAGVELVFAPSVTEMYPDGEPWVAVVPQRGADILEGRSRPGHFRGVLTVVTKLFGIFTPAVAVFGRKDYQQLTLVRQLVADLDLPVEILDAPTVRDPDGLALSSRNRYLSPDERTRALALVSALRDCQRSFEQGETDPMVFRRRLHRAGEQGVSIDYGEVVNPLTLEPVARVATGDVCVLAGWVGTTRLIDNLVLGLDSLS